MQVIYQNEFIYPIFLIRNPGKNILHRVLTAPRGFLQGKKSHDHLSAKFPLNQRFILKFIIIIFIIFFSRIDF